MYHVFYRPGTRQLTLTNLEPSEHYRIHVRARNPSVVENDDNAESLAETVEFTTQPPGSVPVLYTHTCTPDHITSTCIFISNVC